MTDKKNFHQARIAIRSGRDARAFLQLGLLYSKGIGTRKKSCPVAVLPPEGGEHRLRGGR